jgi:hypothetical protein
MIDEKNQLLILRTGHGGYQGSPVTPIRTVAALVVAAGAAYTFSFAIDLLFGGLWGVYPSTVYPAVVTWSAMSCAAIWAACRISPTSRWLWTPYFALGLISAFGGFVSHHPLDFAVAVMLFVHAFLVLISRYNRKSSMISKRSN